MVFLSPSAALVAADRDNGSLDGSNNSTKGLRILLPCEFDKQVRDTFNKDASELNSTDLLILELQTNKCELDLLKKEIQLKLAIHNNWMLKMEKAVTVKDLVELEPKQLKPVDDKLETTLFRARHCYWKSTKSFYDEVETRVAKANKEYENGDKKRN